MGDKNVLKFELIKSDCVQYQNLVAKDLTKLCRILVQVGVPDEPWEAYRGEEKCLYGPSFHRAAEYMITGRTWRETYSDYRDVHFEDD